MNLADPPFVSVVIPTYNEARHISRCLHSILSQDYGGDWEVIVADGMSDDGTRELIATIGAQCPGKLRLIDNPTRNIPSALNCAIRAARGSVIVRIDGHCYVEADHLSRCVQKLNRTDAVCLGPRMLMQPGESLSAQAIASALTTPFGPGTSSFRYSEREQYTDTANFAIYRRAVFDAIGYFDAGLLANEDYDLHYRLRCAGHTILYAPSLRVYYVPRDRYGDLWRQYYRYGYWKSQMLKKFPRSLRLRHTVAPMFVMVVLLCSVGCPLHSAARYALLGILALYASAAMAFSLLQAARKRKALLAPGIALAFLMLHSAWGIGFWIGFGQELARGIGAALAWRGQPDGDSNEPPSSAGHSVNAGRTTAHPTRQ